MRYLRTATALSVAMIVTACGGGEEGKNSTEAPKAKPMELAPNPPVSSSDIDAIVKQQGGGAAAPPATTGNTSGTQGN